MATAIKRGKKWQAEFSYKNPITGKYQKKRKSGFRTKTEAKNYAFEQEKIYKDGYFLDNQVTLSEYYFEWIQTFKKPVVTRNTFSKYITTYKSIQKYFHNILLSDLTKKNYQKILNLYAESHAPATTSKFNNHIKQAVSEAVDEKLIVKNFAEGSIISGTNNIKSPEDKFINYNDVHKLIEYFKTKATAKISSYYMIILAFASGLRYGELWDLTWNDIDFEKGVINVNKTYDYKDKTGFLPTKNKSSNRIVPIDQSTIEIFIRFKKEQESLFSEYNILNKHNLVFYHYIEEIFSNNSINKSLRRAQSKFNINPKISMHGARHTYGSILIYKGIDIAVVSQLLGHRDISTTERVYLHVIEEMKEKNFRQIKEIFTEIYK